jgi:hypothetical protein
MVVESAWQWQYWQSCECLKERWQWMGGSGVILAKTVDGGTTSGSGSMTVVPVDSADQGASNGMIFIVAVAVLAEL